MGGCRLRLTPYGTLHFSTRKPSINDSLWRVVKHVVVLIARQRVARAAAAHAAAGAASAAGGHGCCCAAAGRLQVVG